MVNFDKKQEYLSQTFDNLDISTEEINCKIFEDCSFIECNFSATLFSKCKFIDCHFSKCNLSVTKINYSKFLNITFDECKIIGINWTKASWPNIELSSPIEFHKCILNDSSFFGLSLKDIIIESCKAHDVDFRECNLSQADFTYTDFSYSLFNKTNLSEADFTEATNYNINIFQNNVKKAKFCNYEALRLLDCLEIELID